MKAGRFPLLMLTTTMPAAASRDVLDRFYLRVLGFMYQVLGDAELAAQATQAVFVQRVPPTDDRSVWAAVMTTMHSYLARGFVVRPLVPVTHGWQADLLRGLARLEPPERALLLLRYHEGLHVALIGQILECDEQTVREQIAAARSRLLDVME